MKLDSISHPPKKVAFFANSDWYLYNFRSELAKYVEKTVPARVVCLSPDGPYRPRLEAMGFEWVEIPMERQGINPIAELSMKSKISQELARLQPDLLHNFTLKCVVWGSLAARSAKVPRVVNAIAGLGSILRGDTWKARISRVPLSRLMKSALNAPQTLTILQNPDDMELLIQRQIVGSEKCRLIMGSGVNCEKFQPTEPIDPFTVLFVGRLLKEKGILLFCQAAGLLEKKYPTIQFKVAGDIDAGNPASLKMEELAELKTKHRNINFLGHVENIKVHLEPAALVALPSTYGEGVPRSLIEAAASGKALVATDSTGCREIVRPGINGLLFPPRDVEALANSIETLFLDRNKLFTYGKNSRTIALEEFSSDSVFAKTLQVYREIGF